MNAGALPGLRGRPRDASGGPGFAKNWPPRAPPCSIELVQRAAACIGILALAAALGAMVVGQLVVLPGLESQVALVDANLLTRMIAPIHLRFTEIAMVASLVLLAVTPYWLRSRLITTLALLAVTATAGLRLVMLPAAYEAWAKVDRVAQAPYDRWVRAEGLTEEAWWLGLGSIAMLALMGVVAGMHWLVPIARRGVPGDSPTLSDEAGTTDENPVAHAA